MSAPSLLPTALAERVARERAAHTEDDVLGRSVEVKNRFAHIWTYPGIRRLNAEFDAATAEVRGLRILDLGCGRGERACELLLRGASVVGIDISPVYAAKAADAARAANVEESLFEFLVADAHVLPFSDATFDVVVGNGILHHLDLPRALHEVHRVLRPGGRALFIEPLLDNPLLKVFRLLTPKARTEDERPLSGRDLDRIARSGGWRVESTYAGLLGAPAAVLTSVLAPSRPHNALLQAADQVERRVSARGVLARYHQYVLLNLVRK